jgi:hypothetical protein
MSDETIKSAIRTTALIAFESVDTLTEQQMEAVMIALIECGSDKEAEVAGLLIYHREQARRHQLTLKAILEGAS